MAGGERPSHPEEQRSPGENEQGSKSGSAPPECFLQNFLSDQAALGDLAATGPKALLAYAERTGELLDVDQIARIRRTWIGSGQEHDVYADPVQDRVNRITIGRQYGQNGKDEVNYLSRLASLDRLAPHSDTRVEGVVNRNGWPALVTSMAQLEGRHPTLDELDAFLAERGFESAGANSYRHPSGLELHDAHTSNFIRDEQGWITPFAIMTEGHVGQPL